MTKTFYNEVYQAKHPSRYDGGENGMPQRTAKLTQETLAWLEHTGLAVQAEAKVLEIGCGMAFLAKIHPGWHGAEYSRTAVLRVKERDGADTLIYEEDAQKLSFKDESFDGVYTWAVLEHVPDPDKAFREIDRVLRRGGYGLIAPAWNCRSWTVKKIEQRPISELNMVEWVEKILIPIRELILVRALFALPQRLLAELKHVVRGATSSPLRYKELRPRWDLIERYGHVSDDDAVANIDPHAAICFFRSRGYQIISHSTRFRRLTARHEPVIVRKPL